MNTTLILLVEGCGYLPVRDAGFSDSGDGSIWATVSYRDLDSDADEFSILENAMKGKGNGKGWLSVISPRKRLISKEVTISARSWRDVEGVMFELKEKKGR